MGFETTGGGACPECGRIDPPGLLHWHPRPPEPLPASEAGAKPGPNDTGYPLMGLNPKDDYGLARTDDQGVFLHRFDDESLASLRRLTEAIRRLWERLDNDAQERAAEREYRPPVDEQGRPYVRVYNDESLAAMRELTMALRQRAKPATFKLDPKTGKLWFDLGPGADINVTSVP